MTGRRWIVSLLIFMAAAALVAALLLVSVVVNPDRYRTQIISFLNARTGKQVEIGHVAIQWLSGSIHLYDVGLRNPKPFPAGYILRCARVDAEIKLLPLLHRQISFKSITLQDPVFHVISDPDGLWNFENPPSNRSSSAIPVVTGVVPKVTIRGGQILGSSLIDPSDRPGPIVFEVRGMAASLAGLNLAALSAHQDEPIVTGDLEARSLRLGSIEVTGVKARLRLLPKQAIFQPVSVDAENGHANGELAFNLAEKNAHFTVDAWLTGIDVAQLLRNFAGGGGKLTGTMEGHITVAGPILHTSDPLVGVRANGKLTVRDGEFPGLDSNESLKKMTRFRDPADARRDTSAFSLFSTDLELTHERMTNRDIDLAFYGVDLECSGHLDFNGTGSLDYSGVAKVLKKQGFITSIFAEVFHEARKEKGRLVFPLRITGTMAHPKFALVD